MSIREYYRMTLKTIIRTQLASLLFRNINLIVRYQMKNIRNHFLHKTISTRLFSRAAQSALSSALIGYLEAQARYFILP